MVASRTNHETKYFHKLHLNTGGRPMVASRTNSTTNYFYKLHLNTGGGRWLHREQITKQNIFINCICSPGGADGSIENKSHNKIFSGITSQIILSGQKSDT